MSPRYEALLARLYVDGTARERFLADPRGEAIAARLSPEEADAIVKIDRTGLELAAASFAAKRRHAPPPRRRRWWAQLFSSADGP